MINVLFCSLWTFILFYFIFRGLVYLGEGESGDGQMETTVLEQQYKNFKKRKKRGVSPSWNVW